ncbi:retrovirus-related pol polyprotein from transposon TNT 1-94, partial [Tanacetum coccineum]
MIRDTSQSKLTDHNSGGLNGKWRFGTGFPELESFEEGIREESWKKEMKGEIHAEIFASVDRMDKVRAIIAQAGQKGFEVEGKEEIAYILKKSLYGLKQAPRAWYSKIDDYFKEKGSDQSKSEPT